MTTWITRPREGDGEREARVRESVRDTERYVFNSDTILDATGQIQTPSDVLWCPSLFKNFDGHHLKTVR